MKRKEIILLVLITLLGFGLRFYKLTESPGGLYIDETSIGYNAYSLITTGKDEHGKSWPLFFEAFGEWKLPVYIYSVALAQFIFGPIDATVRIPAVLYGTGTVFCLYLSIKEILLRVNVPYFVKFITPFLAAFLLTIAPWHFQFTHAGFEASSGLFFFVLGLWLFFRSINMRSLLVLMLAFWSFIVSLYAYNSARIVVPVILLILLIFYARTFSIKQLITVTFISLLLVFPFLRFVLSPAGMTRARQITILYDPAYKDKKVPAIIERYLRHLSPYYIFYWGDPTIADLNPNRMGWHYPVELPFFLLGLGIIIKKHRGPYLLFPIIVLIGLIPPAITTSYIHAMRGLFAVIGTTAITALGSAYVFFWFKSIFVRRLTIGAWIVILLCFTTRFLYIYHYHYVPSSLYDWQVHLRLLGQEVTTTKKKYQEIYFVDGISRISLLWYLRIPPNDYQLSFNKLDIGKYHFGFNSTISQVSGKKILLVTPKQDYNAQLVQDVRMDGKTVYKLWEI